MRWLALILALTPNACLAASEACLPLKLKDTLEKARSHYGEIRVISAHRNRAKIRGTNKPSYHASCRAADIVPDRAAHSKLVRWLEKNHDGGVGTYTCLRHIHIDNGPKVRWQKCR